MSSLNVFRIIADVSHTVSKCTLIFAIHANASAEGVSLITQALYAVVFCSRYMDLFWSHPFTHRDNEKGDEITLGIWNFFLKIFYILSSLYIIFLMMRVYGRTHERERAWKFGYACLGGSLLVAVPAMLTMTTFGEDWSWKRKVWEYVWSFSEVLESVCILPQLLLLRQTTVPTVIDSFYLVTLGCYRFFYIPNWILMSRQGREIPTLSLVFGVIQTAFYLDFAWVYYSRQRVKLRNGAIVDGEDFSKGWLVNKILSRAGFKTHDYDGVADSGGARNNDPEQAFGSDNERNSASRGGWGRRGVSVSADDDDEAPAPNSKSTNGGTSHSGARIDPFSDLDDDAEEHDTPGTSSEWK